MRECENVHLGRRESLHQFEEQNDQGLADIARDIDNNDRGEQKWRTLVNKLIVFREM